MTRLVLGEARQPHDTIEFAAANVVVCVVIWTCHLTTG